MQFDASSSFLDLDTGHVETVSRDLLREAEEFGDDEEPLEAAKREFKEETGFTAEGEFEVLDPLRQPSGKIVYAWAVRGDMDASAARSNTFTIEWPKGSGKMREFPEVDRAGWFSLKAARQKLLKGQVAFLDQLEEMLA